MKNVNVWDVKLWTFAIRRKIKRIVNTIQIWKYKLVLRVLSTVRSRDELTTVLNANLGKITDYKGFQILKMGRVEGDTYAVIFCKPGKWVSISFVNIHEFLAGVAELERTSIANAELTGPGELSAIEQAIKPDDNNFGISKIGTFCYETLQQKSTIPQIDT